MTETHIPQVDKDQDRAKLAAFNERGRRNWEAEEHRRRVRRWVRWCVGIPLMLTFPHLGWISTQLLVLGACLISWDIAGWFGLAFERIYYRRQEGFAEPNYGIPESLVAKGDYAAAEKEYEKIMEEFPRESQPHIALIEIAVTRLNDADLAQKLYDRGMRRLHRPKARAELYHAYERISSLLKAPEANGVKPLALKKTPHRIWRPKPPGAA